MQPRSMALQREPTSTVRYALRSTSAVQFDSADPRLKRLFLSHAALAVRGHVHQHTLLHRQQLPVG